MASFKQLELANMRRRAWAKKLKQASADYVHAWLAYQKAEEAHRRLYEQHDKKYCQSR